MCVSIHDVCIDVHLYVFTMYMCIYVHINERVCVFCVLDNQVLSLPSSELYSVVGPVRERRRESPPHPLWTCTYATWYLKSPT